MILPEKKLKLFVPELQRTGWRCTEERFARCIQQSQSKRRKKPRRKKRVIFASFQSEPWKMLCGSNLRDPSTISLAIGHKSMAVAQRCSVSDSLAQGGVFVI